MILLSAARRLPQLVQFGLVGAAAAATHLAAVVLLVALAGLAPLLANVLAFAVAFLVSYHGHATLTFGAAGVRGWGNMGRFLTVAASSFCLNELLYWVALDWMHWNWFWSQAAILLLVAAATFVSSKFWAFRPRVDAP